MIELNLHCLTPVRCSAQARHRGRQISLSRVARRALRLGAAAGRLKVFRPQDFDEAIDTTTALDDRGKLRTVGHAHANTLDDDVDDGEIAVGVA